MDLQTLTHPYTPGAAAGPESYLLVWDAPNLDMGLGAILGGRPTAAHRPRFDAIGRWLIDEAEARSDELGRDVEPEATVFTNVAAASADAIREMLISQIEHNPDRHPVECGCVGLCHLCVRQARGVGGGMPCRLTKASRRRRRR